MIPFDMRKIAFLILFVLATGVVSAQYTVDNKKAVNEFEKGQALLSSNPVKAFEHFEKALKAEPSFAEVHLTMAAWLMDHDSLSGSYCPSGGNGNPCLSIC